MVKQAHLNTYLVVGSKPWNRRVYDEVIWLTFPLGEAQSVGVMRFGAGG